MPKTVCVIGVGFVGKHLVDSFSKKFKVIGVDVSETRVHTLQKLLTRSYSNNVTFQTHFNNLTHCNVFLVSVPTLLDANKNVDMSYLINVRDTLLDIAQPGSLIVIESSVYVGATRQFFQMFLNKGIAVGFSPERVDPGRTSPPIHKIPKIVSGLDSKSLQLVTDTYKNAALELFGTANINSLSAEDRVKVGKLARENQAANKPETKIVMPAGQTKYEETLGKIRAEQDVELVNTAKKSENNISKIDMTLNQIQKSDAITGFGADIQKNVNRFKAKVLNDAKAGKQVADTEILDAFLGSDVFPQIGALGIGAKGLDTPAEREFLRQVMTGTISMDKNALIKMTQIRRDIEKRSIDRYNSAVDSGELNDYFTSTKRQKKLIDIPDNSGFRIVP
jgi:hypothetical protein